MCNLRESACWVQSVGAQSVVGSEPDRTVSGEQGSPLCCLGRCEAHRQQQGPHTVLIKVSLYFCLTFVNPHPRICMFIERGREREASMWETSIGFLLHMPWPGIEPTTQLCALVGDQHKARAGLYFYLLTGLSWILSGADLEPSIWVKWFILKETFPGETREELWKQNGMEGRSFWWSRPIFSLIQTQL